MNEEWKTIPECESYEVSSLGNVRHKIRKKNIRMGKDGGGYLMATLYDKSAHKKITLAVHRLMARVFIGPKPTGAHACHNNGIKTDNRAENIRWASKSENERDKLKHGTALIGERHHQVKLTEERVRQIRSSTETTKALAQRYGVHQTTIWRARAGRRWKYLDTDILRESVSKEKT